VALRFPGIEGQAESDIRGNESQNEAGTGNESPGIVPNRPTPLEKAVARGRELGKLTMYFGALDRTGHYLHIRPHQSIATPWSLSLMGSGLLKNGDHRDVCDGKVFWTCGGFDAFWYAFFW
jgi:hypothetical protein